MGAWPDTRYPDMWVDPEDDPTHPRGRSWQDERTTLLDYLATYRLTLETEVRRASTADAGSRWRSVPTVDDVAARTGEAPGRRWSRAGSGGCMAGQDVPHL